MAGTCSMTVGTMSAVHPTAFFCVVPPPPSNLNIWGAGHQRGPRRRRSPGLSSAFVGSWQGRRPSLLARKQQRRSRGFVVVDEMAGQYDEGFEDVHRQIVNYFTYKAVRTVLHQLYEMNPPKYRWLYNFVVENKPSDGRHFLRTLGKEKQDLAERVMITRLHLYGQWVKKCDHTKMYQKIFDENLQLMRERLMETVIWPSDDTNMEKIG